MFKNHLRQASLFYVNKDQKRHSYILVFLVGKDYHILVISTTHNVSFVNLTFEICYNIISSLSRGTAMLGVQIEVPIT